MKTEILESLKNNRVLITIFSLLSYEHSIKLEKLLSDLKLNKCETHLAYKIKDVKIIKHKVNYFLLSIYFFIVLFNVNLLKWYFRFKKWSKNESVFFVIKSLLKQVNLAVNIKTTNSYDAVFIWNPYCSAYGVLSESLNKLNIETYTIEYGPLKNTLLIDKGFVYDSKLFSSFNCNFKYKNENIYESLLKTV